MPQGKTPQAVPASSIHADTQHRDQDFVMKGHHCHRCYELFYVHSGKCRLLVEDHFYDLRPGDLIFFQGTYDTAGASHVGIVVDPVNKIMIHCGNPIQYASYDTRYWRAHFYCYGRIR